MNKYPPNDAQPGDVFETGTRTFVAVDCIFSDISYPDGRRVTNPSQEIRWICICEKETEYT